MAQVYEVRRHHDGRLEHRILHSLTYAISLADLHMKEECESYDVFELLSDGEKKVYEATHSVPLANLKK